MLTPEFLGLVPGFFSGDVTESVQSLESLLRLCVARDVDAVDLYTMLGYNVSVPPFVRQAMFSRVLDNDDVMATIRKPVLITHGAEDAVVRQAVVDEHRAVLPHADVHIMAGAGHAPFWDDSIAFNGRLEAFGKDIARRPRPHGRPVAV